MAGKRYTHWCINGCGKQVIWNGKKEQLDKFQCGVCGTRWTKDQLNAWGNNIKNKYVKVNKND